MSTLTQFGERKWLKWQGNGTSGFNFTSTQELHTGVSFDLWNETKRTSAMSEIPRVTRKRKWEGRLLIFTFYKVDPSRRVVSLRRQCPVTMAIILLVLCIFFFFYLNQQRSCQNSIITGSTRILFSSFRGVSELNVSKKLNYRIKQ